MSTGQQHHTESNALSFEIINAHVKRIDLTEFTAFSVAPQTAPERAQRLMTAYAAARPILLALSTLPLIPVAWRAIITALLLTLDQITASFRAGKDLATGDSGASDQMEPKLPVG